MKRLTRVSSLLLICIVAFALIVAGCSSNNNNADAPNNANTTNNENADNETNDVARPLIENDKLTLTEQDQVDLTKEAIEEKYANAKQAKLEDLIDYVSYDELELEGNTFTNTTASNQFLRIGIKDDQGILDFSAIDGITGEVGVHVNATIDVSEARGGMYLYLKNDVTQDEGYLTQRHWIDWRNYTEETAVFDSIIELPTYFGVDNAFIEILLPANAKITIHDVFFFMDTEVPGFGDMAEKITGGEGATEENTYVANNAAELYEALEKVKAAEGTPSIIYINGTISYEDWQAASGSDERMIDTGVNTKNLSIIGVADRALLDGVGLSLPGHNIIAENMTVQYVKTQDGFAVNNGTYIWIRHNTIIDAGRNAEVGTRFDELISIKNNARNVIISWNHLQQSGRGILVGSNDEIEAVPDRKVIIHHNFFDNLHSRVPLFRGGYGHVYNNYMKDIDGSASNVRTNAKLRIEHNYYENVKDPIGHFYGGTPGLYELSNNYFDNTSGSQPTESTTTIQFKDYEYELDPVEDVPQIVLEGAGAGKLHHDLEF